MLNHRGFLEFLCITCPGGARRDKTCIYYCHTTSTTIFLSGRVPEPHSH